MTQEKSKKPTGLASLANGAPLNQQSFDDFVKRLHHDCVGEGVNRHYTRDAIFLVQARTFVYGIDKDYNPELALLCEEEMWLSPLDYWNELDEDDQEELNAKCREEQDSDFLSLSRDDQWDFLDKLPNHSVVGRMERWQYVCAHFTRDAADAFIARKGHDYRDGLRVYVDAQSYSWEWNTIKEALIAGKLKFVDDSPLS